MVRSIRLLVKNFLQILQRVLALDDGVLLLVGSHLRAEVLYNNLVWHSERVCDINQVCDVSLYTVQAALLLGLQRGHPVPKMG